ncbi:hypothetical protein EVAR_45704_1 [Eumeta japonica]|uniref:Uncharacterized protein n=1 Tax=Eumeta variegata TaxID=151549 RepID=A0A4C1WXJ1_EUMVA|nr:hypothetical protein EVAR_45704_1 [Eumeta japonica]
MPKPTLSCEWLAHLVNTHSSASWYMPLGHKTFSLLLSIDVNAMGGFVFNSDLTFDSDPECTLVFDPSSVLNFGLGPLLDYDPGPPLDSVSRFAFKSATSHSYNSDKTGGK